MKIEQQYTSQIGEEFAQEMKLQSQRERMIRLAPIGILIFFVFILSIVAEGFFSLKNLQAILSQLSIPLVMSMGLTFVIILGSIDLSGEGLGGFVGAIVSLMVLNSKNAMDMGVLGMIIAVVSGLAVGSLSGVIHVKGKMPSFMVTYAVSSVMAGFAVLSYKGQPAMIQYEFFSKIARGTFFGIPYLTIMALLIFVIAFILQEYTRFGSYVMAIGDNESVARNTGININKTKIKVFAWMGFCIGVAGLLGAIRIGRGEVAIGKGTVFPAITAVVVGGTSLSGGKGGVVNSLVGTLIVTVINNGLILLGVNTYIQSAVQGIIIIAAVALSVARGKKVIVK
jgi:ribose transport system permease protein